MTREPPAASADALLTDLDDEQRSAVSSVEGPLRVLAGAGTGKTRMLTHRIAYAVATGTVDPSSVLAVTFTRRAAGQMRDRLRALGVPPVQAGTFHASALRQLSYFWPRVHGGDAPTLVDRRLPLVARAASRVLGRSLPAAELRDLTGEVDWAKASLVGAADYVVAARTAGREIVVPAADVARVVDAYESAKGAAVDFDDLLVAVSDLLEVDDRTAAEFRSRYRWFTVDEYQDTSPAQQRLLDAWLGGSHELCVVGDVAQTIYTFAGADAGNLIGFERRHPGARTVRLVRDYRSTPQVVAAANTVMAAARGPGASLRVDLQGQRPDGPAPELRGFADETAEADAVAARIAALLALGVPAGEIAVLVRTNAQAEAYEEGLDRAGIAHALRGAPSFFEREEIRRAMKALGAAAARGAPPDDPDSGVGAQVDAVLRSLGHTSEPPAGAAARERWEALEALRSQAVEGLAAGATLTDVARSLAARAASRHAAHDRAVVVATLHATKGLEWDAVFLVGVAEGRLPIRYADTPDAVEEERRLLYVGVTRARVHLWVSWSRRRSRFLDGLLPAGSPRPTAAGRRGGRAAKGNATKATATTAAADLAPAEAELFQALRDWRLGVCRAADTPAFTVFSDAALVAIALARPTDLDALLAVKGVGPAKSARYGEAVLAVVAAAD